MTPRVRRRGNRITPPQPATILCLRNSKSRLAPKLFQSSPILEVTLTLFPGSDKEETEEQLKTKPASHPYVVHTGRVCYPYTASVLPPCAHCASSAIILASVGLTDHQENVGILIASDVYLLRMRFINCTIYGFPFSSQ